MTKRMVVRVGTLLASLAGLILAGGAGWSIK